MLETGTKRFLNSPESQLHGQQVTVLGYCPHMNRPSVQMHKGSMPFLTKESSLVETPDEVEPPKHPRTIRNWERCGRLPDRIAKHQSKS